MVNLTPDVLRKNWWSLSANARTLFMVLYETQDYVPTPKLAEQLSTTPHGIIAVLGWITYIIDATEDGWHYKGGGFEEGYGGYRLMDHLRPVVGELLGHHEKGKTILLESLWNMAKMVELLEKRIGDIPGDIPIDFSMDFMTRQQELDSLLQDLLKDNDEFPQSI